MTLIQRLDGTTYDLLDYGIRTRDVLISSPAYEHNFSAIEGSIGLIDNESTIRERTINCLYRATSHGIQDFSLLRDEIFDIFRSEEPFYLIEKRLPGKRWLVKVSNTFQIPQRNVFGNFDVEFISIRGVSESIGTSADIDKNGIPKDWIGMGFDGISELSYKTLVYGKGSTTDQFILPFFSVKNSNALGYFRIFNPGIAVHPFEQEIKISVYDADGSDEYLELVNNTNGSSFRLNEGLENKKLVIDGPNITLNNLQALRKTNRKYVELSPGWNEFSLKGAIKATIEFDFRFYYL